MSDSADVDAAMMGRALQLAARGLYTTDPNPRVGCVIVRDGEIVGEGWHQWAGEAHAEIRALQAAGDRARGATVYLTLEPCCHHGRTPPCTDALIAAGVRRVICAMRDPNPRVTGEGFAALAAAGIEVEHRDGSAPAARKLNVGFVRRMATGRPWVRVKLATSLDGGTALASGESRWITGEAARRDVHRWRARASCILTGCATVIADDPSLNVRLTDEPGQPVRQPWLAILDTDLRTPPKARVFDVHERVILFTTSPEAPSAAALQARGAEIVGLPAGAGGVDLAAVCRVLGDLEVNEVHVEAGATLCGALAAAGLLDELILYMAPNLLGDTARGAFSLPPLNAMDERMALHIEDIRRVGNDLRIRALPIQKRE